MVHIPQSSFLMLSGTMVPNICPNGTYTFDNTTGLQEKSECLPCETSLYCRSGQLSGLCVAGYYCKSGAKSDIPSSTNNFTACLPDEECAGFCPTGHYCEEGTLVPTECPEATFRNVTGAEQLSDCDICPAGFICDNGEKDLCNDKIVVCYKIIWLFIKIWFEYLLKTHSKICSDV